MINFRSTTGKYRTWSGLENSSHKIRTRVCFFIGGNMEKELLKTLFELAEKSLKEDEFPVSAIIYDDTGIISTGYNCRNRTNKTTDHAEIIAIENANKKLKNWNLQNKCMIVTLEPCDMCKSVIKEARLKKTHYLIPRYKYKKQYKCTDFELKEIDAPELKKYRQDITTFFINKR